MKIEHSVNKELLNMRLIDMRCKNALMYETCKLYDFPI